MMHQARRGDEVEAWIKRCRDEYENDTSSDVYNPYEVIDWMLDDYRLHADTGTPLNEPVNEEIMRGDPGKSYTERNGKDDG